MDMMGTQTKSAFFKGPGQQGTLIKPIEMIKSKNSKNFIQQLWFERAEKVMKNLHHFSLLLDSFKYMGEIAYKFTFDTVPSLKKSFKEEKIEKLKQKKYDYI